MKVGTSIGSGKTAEKLVGYIFSLVGSIFLVIGICIIMGMSESGEKVETTGTISRIRPRVDSEGDTQYEVYVDYDIDGVMYSGKMNYYSSTFREGKQIKMYYLAEDPYVIGTKAGDALWFIFPGMGALFLVLGLVFVFKDKVADKKANDLKLNGTCIQAKYIETEINTAYTVNGQNPFRIVCEWTNPSTGTVERIKSENIWNDPRYDIDNYNITSFPVYVDMKNTRRYYIDVKTLDNFNTKW